MIGPVLKARDELDGGGRRKRVPVLLKVAPDLTEEDKADIAEVVTSKNVNNAIHNKKGIKIYCFFPLFFVQHRVDGLIVSNTTVSRPENLNGEDRGEVGGLSGRPLREASTKAVADFYRLTKGKCWG